MLAALGFAAIPALAQTRPDFSGNWNSSTATPLQRSAQLKDKPFFTKEEAAAFERQAAARNQDRPIKPTDNPDTQSYNEAWYEHSAQVVKTLRTSIVIDPPDGRLPALTPPAAALKQRRLEGMKHPQSVDDLGLQDRCLAFETSAPPMLPYRYNSNYQIIQTGELLMIYSEMGHDVRIIPLDGRQHPAADVRLWLGDSVGHWEGGVLLVDTRNYNDADGLYGDAGGMYGWDRNLHVVERFSLMDKDTILYEFSVDDPTAFTKPWKGEYTISRSTAQIFEYACHEGTYAVPNLMKSLQ